MIIPTILTSNYDDLLKKVSLLDGITDWVQIDIIDGIFAPQKTIDPEALGELDLNIKRDLHLMVSKPEGWIERSLKVLPDRIIGQVEKMEDPFKFITETAEAGVEVGLAFDLDTPINSVSDNLLQMVDLILLMSVKAGEGGQDFNQSVLQKIRDIRKIVDPSVSVAIDGGLNKENIKLCKDNGADIFYVGSTLWNSDNPLKTYKELEYIAGTIQGNSN